MNNYNDMSKLMADMKSLWKETFMDSDDYINLVFDNYFAPENCFYIYDNNQLVSEMLCVPYVLTGNVNICKADADNKESNIISDDTLYSERLTYNNHISLKFSYQCGLATKYDYRQKGLMTSLINKSNRCLINNKFVLSILIPSDEAKSLYYSKFGYVGITYINNCIYENYNDIADNSNLTVCKSDNGYKLYSDNVFVGNLYDIHNDYDFDYNDLSLCNNEDILKLYSFYSSLLSEVNGCYVSHSIKDFITVLHENFVSGGKVLLMVDNDNIPLAMLFCCKNEEGSATVQLLLSRSEKSGFILLQFLRTLLPNIKTLMLRKYEMKRCCDAEANSNFLSREHAMRPSDFPDSDNLVAMALKKKCAMPYAMAKILNVAEILKFVATLYPNSDFSILVNHDEFEENEGFYHVKNGKLFFQPLKKFSDIDYREAVEKFRNSPGKYILSVPELATILFRPIGDIDFSKSGTSAAAIPRIALNVALMLD